MNEEKQHDLTVKKYHNKQQQ